MNTLVGLNNIISKMIKDALLDVSNFALYNIVTNTNKGKNADNKPFASYSRGYARRRAKKGLGSRPNMQWSSAMIQSIRIETNKLSEYKVVIKPTGSVRGIGNDTKMRYLEQTKNYTILKETPYLRALIQKRFEKYILSRWRNL